MGSGGRKTGREAQLERIRRLCAKLPSVSEKLSHGTPTFFVEKDKGVFAMFATTTTKMVVSLCGSPCLKGFSAAHRRRARHALQTAVRRVERVGGHQTGSGP
jgi:hypothetical protein